MYKMLSFFSSLKNSISCLLFHRLLIKTRSRSRLDSSVSIEDVISLDESVSIDNLTLSPTHYIEKAINYLPNDAVEVFEHVATKATKKVADAQTKASETVHKTRERASSFLYSIRSNASLTSREDISLDIPVSTPDGRDSRSTTSSEDLRSEATAKPDVNDIEDDLESSSGENDAEDELCSLIVNILFTIMWRGQRTAEAVKERGCVIATINMLALDSNNELHKSHIELKRQLIELSIQAVLADMKDSSLNSAEVMSQAENVMQWAFDLVVLDPYGNFDRKVSEPLLDGILALTEALMVFSEGKEDLEWADMAKMAFEILLICAEKATQEDICTMATAKLHALVQTRASSPLEESAFLMFRLSTMILKCVENDKHYSYLLPIMKALLEKTKTAFNLQSQVPTLNLRLAGPQFFEHFKTYCTTEEWTYFTTKKVQPLHDEYKKGYLNNLPQEMDVFWAESYELTKVFVHKRSREVGESKLKFQSKYEEPYRYALKCENSRFNNVLGQLQSHASFIRKRWQMSKRQFLGPRGAWSDADSTVWSEHWLLAYNENFERMRMKLIPNYNFDPHIEASAQRDNVQIEAKTAQSGQNLLNFQLSKDAVRSELIEDSLTEDDLKSIAKDQMETAHETDENEKLSEKLVLSEDCQRVTYMSVVKGKLEVTTNFVYFFDASPYREDQERHDFRYVRISVKK